jgi:hypothetical protein
MYEEKENFAKVINGLRIDPAIFIQKFVKACDISICGGECCCYGVYTDLKESEKIKSIQDCIINSLDDSQTSDTTKWFEAPKQDNDFESGWAVGTEICNGKCVFKNKNGFCVLQQLAIKTVRRVEKNNYPTYLSFWFVPSSLLTYRALAMRVRRF